jgi:hypothetical protein
MIERLKTWLAAKLFNAPNPDYILKIENGRMYLHNLEITKELAGVLREEAKAMSGMGLWQIMQHTLAEDARERMFKNSTNFDDMRNGKMMLYNLDIQQKILDRARAFPVTPVRIDTK